MSGNEGIRRQLEGLEEEGSLDRVEGRTFASLVSFESGTRLGLFLTEDGYEWAVVRDDVLVPFSEKGARAFVEALEMPRSEFDEALERGAGAHGLEVADVLLDFPAIDLVRWILAARSSFLSRLALEWPLPSELRELRDAISAAAEDPQLPVPVRELARRLVVPA